MGKVEVVVACGVKSECRIILSWSKINGSATLPSSNHTGTKKVGADPILRRLVGDEFIELCKHG